MKQKIADALEGTSTFFLLTQPLWFTTACALGAAALAPAFGVAAGTAALTAGIAGAVSGTLSLTNLLKEAAKNKPDPVSYVLAFPAMASTAAITSTLDATAKVLHSSFNKAAKARQAAKATDAKPQMSAKPPETKP